MIVMRTLIIINSERFGIDDKELGDLLICSFLRKLWANKQKPDAIIFYHTGVKLLTKKSQILDALEALSKAGVDLIICGTCAGYYDVKDEIQYGRVSDMTEIVRLIMDADKVITP